MVNVPGNGFRLNSAWNCWKIDDSALLPWTIWAWSKVTGNILDVFDASMNLCMPLAFTKVLKFLWDGMHLLRAHLPWLNGFASTNPLYRVYYLLVWYETVSSCTAPVSFQRYCCFINLQLHLQSMKIEPRFTVYYASLLTANHIVASAVM